MSDINGIPNMGFMGGGGGYFGGSSSMGLPAMNSDQINASMGWGGPNAAQFDPWANSGGFGNMTDYYSGLGAAYGRETGGFDGSAPGWAEPTPGNAIEGGYPAGPVESAPLDPPPYTPFGMGTAFDMNTYSPATSFSGRWGEDRGSARDRCRERVGSVRHSALATKLSNAGIRLRRGRAAFRCAAVHQ